MTLHTSGPWIAWDDGRTSGSSTRTANLLPCWKLSIMATWPTRRKLRADQRLAAAAPDMLAALAAMRRAYGRLHDFLSDAIEGGRLSARAFRTITTPSCRSFPGHAPPLTRRPRSPSPRRRTGHEPPASQGH